MFRLFGYREPKCVAIYALTDPRTNEIRYVGSSRNPKARLSKHNSCELVNSAKDSWVMELKFHGGPRMEVIEYTTETLRTERERHWISTHASAGAPLLNIKLLPTGWIAPAPKSAKDTATPTAVEHITNGQWPNIVQHLSIFAGSVLFACVALFIFVVTARRSSPKYALELVNSLVFALSGMAALYACTSILAALWSLLQFRLCSFVYWLFVVTVLASVFSSITVNLETLIRR